LSGSTLTVASNLTPDAIPPNAASVAIFNADALSERSRRFSPFFRRDRSFRSSPPRLPFFSIFPISPTDEVVSFFFASANAKNYPNLAFATEKSTKWRFFAGVPLRFLDDVLL